jgi:hypothetical protein
LDDPYNLLDTYDVLASPYQPRDLPTQHKEPDSDQFVQVAPTNEREKASSAPIQAQEEAPGGAGVPGGAPGIGATEAFSNPSPPPMDVAPTIQRQDVPLVPVTRVEGPRETPRPDRVNREIARLKNHNKPGSSEANPPGRRERRAPSRFTGNLAVTNENREIEFVEGFEHHFNNFIPPSWNADRNCFETTDKSERDSLFANRFHLDPSHPSFVEFEDI